MWVGKRSGNKGETWEDLISHHFLKEISQNPRNNERVDENKCKTRLGSCITFATTTTRAKMIIHINEFGM